jgi:hypothetical protein
LKEGKLIFMPDKQKARGQRQASLTEAPEDKPDGTDSLVAKAFDSEPSVRLKVAQSLSKIDDPRAIFALIELSSDKEDAVREAAKRALGNFKEEEEEIVSIGKLLSERKAQPAPSAPAQAGAQQPSPRASMMPAIEKLFAHYEPKKRESAKRKLLPSLQKLFGFRPEELDPLRELDKIGHSKAEAMQPEAQEETGQREEGGPKNAENFPFGKHEEPPEGRQRAETLVEVSDEDVEVVSEGEDDDFQEEREPAENGKYYSVAYQIASTPGMGKSGLKREQNRIIAGLKHEVELAFKLAAARVREDGMASLSSLKPGMKKLSFSEMQVAAVSEVAYGARRKPYARIVLFDGKREVPLLVPRERASGISIADKIAPKKVAVDFIVEKNEIVLVAGPKSSIVVYK